MEGTLAGGRSGIARVTGDHEAGAEGTLSKCEAEGGGDTKRVRKKAKGLLEEASGGCSCEAAVTQASGALSGSQLLLPKTLAPSFSRRP